HFSGSRRWQPYMARLADLCRNDVHIDSKQAAFLYRVHDGLHHLWPVAIGHRRHGILHQICAFLVGFLELECIQRRLVMITSPDVVDPAFALDEQLVHIGSRTPDKGIRRPRITLLMTPHPHTSATRTPDVSSSERDVHKSAVGAVIVVTPNQALLIGEHGASSRPALLWLSDPGRGLGDLIGGGHRQ